MQHSSPDQPPQAEQDGKAKAAAERAERYRERFRQSQVIAAKKARSEAAGGRPSEQDAARLVAEFIARGGHVTVCPTPDDPSPEDPGARSRRG